MVTGGVFEEVRRTAHRHLEGDPPDCAGPGGGATGRDVCFGSPDEQRPELGMIYLDLGLYWERVTGIEPAAPVFVGCSVGSRSWAWVRTAQLYLVGSRLKTSELPCVCCPCSPPPGWSPVARSPPRRPPQLPVPAACTSPAGSRSASPSARSPFPRAPTAPPRVSSTPTGSRTVRAALIR